MTLSFRTRQPFFTPLKSMLIYFSTRPFCLHCCSVDLISSRTLPSLSVFPESNCLPPNFQMKKICLESKSAFWIVRMFLPGKVETPAFLSFALKLAQPQAFSLFCYPIWERWNLKIFLRLFHLGNDWVFSSCSHKDSGWVFVIKTCGNRSSWPFCWWRRGATVRFNR